jgi:hypothetical protein
LSHPLATQSATIKTVPPNVASPCNLLLQSIMNVAHSFKLILNEKKVRLFLALGDLDDVARPCSRLFLNIINVAHPC